ITRAGADFENSIAGRHAGFLAHERNGVRLRDRLLVTDRKCAIVVGVALQVVRHELVARHPFHRLEHARILDASLLELIDEHVMTSDFECHRTDTLLKNANYSGAGISRRLNTTAPAA